jgi:hypothetical protein
VCDVFCNSFKDCLVADPEPTDQPTTPVGNINDNVQSLPQCECGECLTCNPVGQEECLAHALLNPNFEAGGTVLAGAPRLGTPVQWTVCCSFWIRCILVRGCYRVTRLLAWSQYTCNQIACLSGVHSLIVAIF